MIRRDRARHFVLSETQRFLLLAILIGIFSGLMVVCFHITIDLISWYSLGALLGKYRYGRLISSSLGALVATFLRRAFSPPLAAAVSIRPRPRCTSPMAMCRPAP